MSTKYSSIFNYIHYTIHTEHVIIASQASDIHRYHGDGETDLTLSLAPQPLYTHTRSRPLDAFRDYIIAVHTLTDNRSINKSINTGAESDL